jgi:hypothetical protein
MDIINVKKTTSDRPGLRMMFFQEKRSLKRKDFIFDDHPVNQFDIP